MEESLMSWFFVAEIALLGGLCLALPRIGRRGLLFGSYVGEAASSGQEAAEIRRRWDRVVLLATALCTAAAAALAISVANPLAAMAPMLPLGVAIVVLYLRCYREARALAARSGAQAAPPPAAASLALASRDPLPWISLAIGVAGGVAALIYTMQSYDAMPDRIPVHFGPSGKPDGWAVRSFGSVFFLPLLTIVMGILIGGGSVLTARAKRALRARDGGVSLEAQERFRRATARFLAVVGLITSTMLTTMSIYATRTAIGVSPGLPPWILAFAGTLLVYATGGAIYLMVRYGQGGAQLESRTAAAPLTDGLADDRFWKLGMFYVNPEDPSWLVEKRFGFGYTLNFGNRAALATFVSLMLALFALVFWAIASS